MVTKEEKLEYRRRKNRHYLKHVVNKPRVSRQVVKQAKSKTGIQRIFF